MQENHRHRTFQRSINRTAAACLNGVTFLWSGLYHPRRAVIGHTVFLRCGHAKNSRVDWHVRRLDHNSEQIVVIGQLTNGNFNGRLGINSSTLVINDVRVDDSGDYICIEDEGRGQKHWTRLYVHGITQLLNLQQHLSQTRIRR